jgi:N-hydroxyarylamine O-acetyltransferase
MVLRVDFGRESWLADVGFGGEGLLRPIRLREGEVARQSFWTYRIARDRGGWVLQLLRGDRPFDLYSFTEEPQEPVDYEVANWYTSTHPDSHFLRTLTAQRSTAAERMILRNRELIVDRGGPPQVEQLTGNEQVMKVLRERFGIELPTETRLPDLR